jgi:hypothetical protein
VNPLLLLALPNGGGSSEQDEEGESWERWAVVAVAGFIGWADLRAGAAESFFSYFFSFSFYLFFSLALLRRRFVCAYASLVLILLTREAQLVILKKSKGSCGKDSSCN